MSLFTDETEAEYGLNTDKSSFNSTLHAIINVVDDIVFNRMLVC